MHEFDFKINAGKTHEKIIQVFLYDGDNIHIYYKNKATKLWDSYLDRPFLEIDYCNLQPYRMFWMKNGMWHRKTGPANIYFYRKYKYNHREIDLFHEENPNIIYGEKVIQGEIIFKKEINSFKDWLTFDSSVI